MIPEISLLMFSVLLVAVMMIFILRNVNPLMPFIYSNAVIQSRSPKLIKDSQWEELAESKSLNELINFLRDSDYSEELGKARDLRGFHAAIEKSFIESVFELRKLSADKLKPVFDAYLMFWEAKIVKAFYRARFTHVAIDEGLVFPVDNITPAVLGHLKDTKTINDMKVVMLQTIYADVFKKEYERLEDFEVEIDNFVLEHFADVARKMKMYDARYIIEILNTKFDILNILALLKAEARNIPVEKRMPLLINNHTELWKLLPKLAETKSIQDFIALCGKLPFYSYLHEALESYNKDKSLSHFEKQLYRYYKNFVQSQELMHSLGPYPLFAYLTKKEMEHRNLLSISKGIDARFSPTEIKELIV